MLRTDLKIFLPEKLGNEETAGGHRTANAITSGKLNEVFSSISDYDHARSSFDIVKLYPALSTDDDSRLQDAHIFLSDQPDDPLVNVLLVESPDLKETSLVSDMTELLPKSSTKYHGTSFILDDVALGAKELRVEAVTRTLTPSIKNVSTKIGLKPDSDPLSIYRTKRILSYGDISQVNIAVDDFLESNPIYYGEYQYAYSYTQGEIDEPTQYFNVVRTKKIKAGLGELNSLKYENGTFSCELLNPAVTKDQYFTLFYVSNLDFRFHSFSSSTNINLSAGETLLKGHTRLKKAGDNTVYEDDGQGRFIAGGYIFATIDYETGAITATDGNSIDYEGTVSENLGSLISKGELTIRKKQWQLASSSFERDSLYISYKTSEGTEFSASSDASGEITGTNCTGTVSETGYVDITFSVDVAPDSIRYDYNEVEVVTVPAAPGGFDTSVLPNNGTVNIFHNFGVVSIQNRQRTIESSLSNGQVLNVLVDADFIDIVDSNGASLWSVTDESYSYDKETGELTINSGISNFTAPFIVSAIQSELVTISGIDGNDFKLLTPLKRAYPALSTISSTIWLGNLQANSKYERTIPAWQNNFGDQTEGASSSINTVQYPIELNNIGAINQRWAIVFTSSTAYNVVGEFVGTIYSGDILNDCAPINRFVNSPYFILRKDAFGAGLNPGEAFLFTTEAASKPIMATRSVSPGHSEITIDNSTLSFRGNKD